MGFHKGYPIPEKTRALMRAAALGRVMLPETREKIRQTRLGKKLPEETKAKISASMQARWREKGHAGKFKFTVPAELTNYARKLRNNRIKGEEFRRAIEAAL